MSFEQILSTNLINFLIVISTLVLIFKKAHLGDLIEKLVNDVQSQVEKSATSAKDAIAEYKNTKKEVKNTSKLQEEILANAEKNAKNLIEKNKKDTEIKQEEIKKNIEKIINSEKENFKNSTIKEIYSSCVDIAKDEIIKRLDEKTGRKLINSSIEALDNIEGNLS